MYKIVLLIALLKGLTSNAENIKELEAQCRYSEQKFVKLYTTWMEMIQTARNLEHYHPLFLMLKEDSFENLTHTLIILQSFSPEFKRTNDLLQKTWLHLQKCQEQLQKEKDSQNNNLTFSETLAE